MVITYLGKSFVKITQGDLTIAVNPIGKDGAWPGKPTKFASNIALSSLNDENYRGWDTVVYGDTEPFMISGAGDYEVKELFIKGVPTEKNGTEGDEKKENKKDAKINTAYTVIVDGITLAFLGAVTGSDLPTESKEALMHPDVLFVPIDADIIDTAKAYKLAMSLEPMLIIPLEWDGKDGDAALKKFLKEAGEEGVQPVDKLTLKRKDLDGKEGDVIVVSCT